METLFHVRVGLAIPLHSKKTSYANQETEILTGESYVVLGRSGAWIRVRALLDGYQGFIQRKHHEEHGREGHFEGTHRVAAAKVNVYCRATFKSVVWCQLPLNAQVTVTKRINTDEGQMGRIAPNAWVFMDQLRKATEPAEDFVEEVEKLEYQLYDWGGRGTFGWDCSAAIQAGCIAAGIPCARDAGPQSATLGDEVPLQEVLERGSRGDFVFWTDKKGRHVAVLTSEGMVVHFSITDFLRCGARDALSTVIKDQERHGNGLPTVARRIPGHSFL